MGKRRITTSSSSSSSEERHRCRKQKLKRKRDSNRDSSRPTPPKKKKLSAEEQTIALSADVLDRVKAILDLDPTASSALLAIAQRLDEYEGVQLHAIEDSRARKKLRHLLYTLGVESTPDPISHVPTHFKKSTSKISITNVIDAVLLRSPASTTAAEQRRPSTSHDTPPRPSTATMPAEHTAAPQPRGPANDQRAASNIEAEYEYGPSLPTEVECDEDSDKPKREEWMQLAPQSLAGAFGAAKLAPAVHSTIDPRKKLLQEREQKRMAEQMAFYQELRGDQKSLAEIHRENKEKGVELDLSRWRPENDVWGTSAVEQHFKSKQKDLNSKNNLNEGQPWRRFDRERDLNTNRPASAADCDKMKQLVTASTGRFGQSSFLTSNV